MVPDPGNVWRNWEPFQCLRDSSQGGCFDTRNRRWDPRARAHRACKRADLQPVEPDVYMPRLLHYHGRSPDPHLDPDYWPGIATARLGAKEPWWKTPPEDYADGCPGSWIQSQFAQSFSTYYRHRTDDGGRVPNLELQRADDWLIDVAVMYFERQEERRIAHHEKIRHAAAEARRKAAKGGGK